MTKKWSNNFFPSRILIFFSNPPINFFLNKRSLKLTQQQKRFLKKIIGENAINVKSLYQIHGKRAVIARRSSSPFQKADAIVTNKKDVAIMIRTADCLPIFIFDPKLEVIGLVHAGWKGTKKKVVINALKYMQKRFKTHTKDLRVLIGPSIHVCCYEVSAKFSKDFPRDILKRKGRYYLDLNKANINQLVASGVQRRYIKDSKECTCCNKNSYSYRRQGQKAGRMAAIMMIKQ